MASAIHPCHHPTPLLLLTPCRLPCPAVRPVCQRDDSRSCPAQHAACGGHAGSHNFPGKPLAAAGLVRPYMGLQFSCIKCKLRISACC